VSQVEQELAQVRQRLLLARVGPQQEGEALARLGRVTAQQQIGQQRLDPRRVQRRQRLVAEAQLDAAEQAREQNRLLTVPATRSRSLERHAVATVRTVRASGHCRRRQRRRGLRGGAAGCDFLVEAEEAAG